MSWMSLGIILSEAAGVRFRWGRGCEETFPNLPYLQMGMEGDQVYLTYPVPSPDGAPTPQGVDIISILLPEGIEV